MKERVRIFTYASGEGSTLAESDLQAHINEWLADVNGKLLHVRQSESHRPGSAQHITISVWYLPEESVSES